jgi:hypothetical protein
VLPERIELWCSAPDPLETQGFFGPLMPSCVLLRCLGGKSGLALSFEQGFLSRTAWRERKLPWSRPLCPKLLSYSVPRSPGRGFSLAQMKTPKPRESGELPARALAALGGTQRWANTQRAQSASYSTAKVKVPWLLDRFIVFGWLSGPAVLRQG